MNNIINFGSMNKDYVYTVDAFVRPGETISAEAMNYFPGGKGLNQSISIARAGAKVSHVGFYGEDGEVLKKYLMKENVEVSRLKKINIAQGHAIIQVNNKGENCIIVYAGSNKSLTTDYIDEVLADCPQNSIVVLQNEINNVSYIVNKAFEFGMQVVLNPSPMDAEMRSINLNKIQWLLINEIEGKEITGFSNGEEIIEELGTSYPNLGIILTEGSKGATCFKDGKLIKKAAYIVDVVDTTAAGDTFTGYFIAGLSKENDLEEILNTAMKAAAMCVSKMGAAPSIPVKEDVLISKL